jgi:hypothetical protein
MRSIGLPELIVIFGVVVLSIGLGVRYLISRQSKVRRLQIMQPLWPTDTRHRNILPVMRTAHGVRG